MGRKYLFIYLIIFIFSFWQVRAMTADSIRVSLLTCSPGQEIYSLFGHTAVRYEDPSQGIDAVFNYGMFSFRTPNFIWRFVKGETDYELGVTDFSDFEMEYAMRGSSVYQQTLNLLPEEKQRLLNILIENYQPENRVYRYNFFFDNCTTRARDKIEESINGKIDYHTEKRKLSFRDIIHQYTSGHPWSEFGIDLCLGSKADVVIDYRQEMFAPFYLLHAVDSARIVVTSDSVRLLVVESREIVHTSEITSNGERRFFITPMVFTLLVFAITLIFSICGIVKNKMFWGLDLILFAGAGAAGCVIAFLVCLSVHPTVSPNYLLFFLNPIHLLYLPFMIYRSTKRKKDMYHWMNLSILTLFMLCWWIIPQKINPAVLPLALSLMVRSATHLFLIYKRK